MRPASVHSATETPTDPKNALYQKIFCVCTKAKISCNKNKFFFRGELFGRCVRRDGATESMLGCKKRRELEDVNLCSLLIHQIMMYGLL